MTVGTTHTFEDFTGDNSTVDWAVTFRLFEQTQIEYYEDGVPGTLGVDFTVVVDPGFAGGTITSLSTPATDVAIHIRRRTPKTQTSNFTDVEDFPSDTVERAFDLAVMRDQERQDPDFFSAPQTVTADTNLSVTHGLATKPNRVRLVLVNATTEHNYAAGDTISWTDSNVAQATDGGVDVVPNATTIDLIQGVSFTVLDKTGFNAGVITPASWKWRVEVWL